MRVLITKWRRKPTSDEGNYVTVTVCIWSKNKEVTMRRDVYPPTNLQNLSYVSGLRYHGAAARRSAANAGSAVFTAKGRG